MATKTPGTNRIARLAPYAIAAAAGGVAVWFALRVGVAPPRPEPARAAAAAARLDPLRTRPAEYDWTEQPAPAFPVPPYARFLTGASIVIDPGHVGQSEKNRSDNWKRGPTGLREAEANLRVALYLREFLDAAGAKVTMTRDQDAPRDISDDDDLADRAAIANRLRADLLISIHHNASDKSPEANYTAVFYHGDAAESPASLSAGRHLLAGINDALRLERHVDCALWSDYQIHPVSGFRLLRLLHGPGVLCESSFHTNPAEEDRLRDPVYNRREAYGMFLGLARWAQAGLPRVTLVDPPDGRVRPGQTITLQIDDGLSRRDGKGPRARQMMKDSLVVEFEGRRLAYRLADPARGTLQLAFPDDYPVSASPAPFDSDDPPVRAMTVAFPPPKSNKKDPKPPARNPGRTPPRSSAPRSNPAARAPVPSRGPGGPRLFVDFSNIFGQHVLHPWIDVTVVP